MSGLFERVRSACARVAGQAKSVRIDAGPLARLARALAEEAGDSAVPDPAHQRVGDAASTLAFVVTLDAINFGSGWFPHLRKRPGCSGYLSIAAALRERFERHGAWDAEALEALEPRALAEVLGQDPGHPPVADLMTWYARSLRELGGCLRARHAGRFEALVAAAGGSAARLVAELLEMPLYRDAARYAGFEVPFYKRAQITAADLALAFGGAGPGRFDDLDRLTLFADNLVPHVLRCEGVLRLAPALEEAIAAGRELPAGSPEEVELRAVAVHAVEGCVAELARLGVRTSARELDLRLWTRGQRPEIKAHPRHRTRSPYY